MTGVVCASALERLMDYLEGAVAADLAALLEAHVASCERCEAFVASYRATPGILREATEVPLSPERRQALHAFLRSRHR
jgi:anti-sigma factor RsiW